MDRAERLREAVLALAVRSGSLDAAWAIVIADLERIHGLAPLADLGPVADDVPGAPWTEPAAVELLGDVHASLVEGRHASGTYYTPPFLVDWLVERTLAADTRSVLDPSCGAGHVLVGVVRRLIELGVPAADAVDRVAGTDLDPVAVALARLRLRVLAGASAPAPDVRVADGLGPHPGAPVDLVVGNPPFAGRLRGASAGGSAARAALGPYADLSAAFLDHALDLVAPGGTVALVQPLSVLATRDTALLRRRVTRDGAVTAFWCAVEPVFDGTTVRTCVPVVRRSGGSWADGDRVPTWYGPTAAPGPAVSDPGEHWARMAAPALGIPEVTLSTDGRTLADVARVTADFRDQYYGLAPFVGEATDDPDAESIAPLITTGLIDPARSRWGEATTRFHKHAYERPVVDLAALRADGRLADWADARLVPKVVVATQGRVLEAVVDVEGCWLPSVPVVTVAASPAILWHLLAVLLSPPIVADAAARHVGAALSPTAIKLSASQIGRLPLPADKEAWDRGADAARRAQSAASSDARSALLREVATTMCAAYRDDRALAWWCDRAGLPAGS